ncbi:hypothetical protein FRC04_000688 [Tulasnella sp. 424]|nr:hypothetical protein FRC04_000688 [Tulasnella sp. 424]
MFSSYKKIQVFALLAVLNSSVAYGGQVGEGASPFEARASTLTLPDIFKNGTAQVISLGQKLRNVIVFNNTLKAEPAYVQSVLTQVNAVIDNTAAQINQIGKLPFDQISEGLSESDIQYISTDFLNAVAVSVTAPQSIAAAYPEIQKGIDTITYVVSYPSKSYTLSLNFKHRVPERAFALVIGFASSTLGCAGCGCHGFSLLPPHSTR